MKDAQGHGSNPRGNARQDAIIRGKGIDQRHFPNRMSETTAATDLGQIKPKFAMTDYGRALVARQMAAHQSGTHQATAGKKL